MIEFLVNFGIVTVVLVYIGIVVLLCANCVMGDKSSLIPGIVGTLMLIALIAGMVTLSSYHMPINGCH